MCYGDQYWGSDGYYLNYLKQQEDAYIQQQCEDRQYEQMMEEYYEEQQIVRDKMMIEIGNKLVQWNEELEERKNIFNNIINNK